MRLPTPRCEMQPLLYNRAGEPRSDARVPELMPAAGLKGRDGLVTEEMGLVEQREKRRSVGRPDFLEGVACV